MEILLSPAAWMTAMFIFGLRVADMALDTLRLLFVVRGRKRTAWILGFFQSLIFVIAIGSVLSDLNNPLNILSYAAGFATGNVVGMLIEERLAVGYIQVTVISPNRGAAIADTLRNNGFAVTEMSGRGRNGTVTVLNCGVKRKDMDNVETTILEADPDAFVTADDVRPVRRGFWRA